MPIYRLLIYKLRILFSRIFRVEGRRKALRILSFTGLAVVFGLFIAGAAGFFGALRGMEPGGEALGALLVAVTFHALLILAFVLDVATTTNIFFLSSDLPLLMAAPISTTKVFALKYLEALATGSLVSLFIALPVLLGYGIGFGAPVYFYVGIVLLLPVFLSIPVSVGTIAGFVVARYVRASKVREILGLVGGGIGLAFWIGFQVIRPSLGNPDQVRDFTATLRAYATGSGALRFLPSYHAASALTALRAGTPSRALVPVLLLVATSAVLLGISMAAARRMYLAGWTRVAPAGKKHKAGRGRPLLETLLFWAPAAERAVMSTTARLFLRDPQQMMSVAMMSIMITVFPFLTARREGTGTVLSPILLISIAGLGLVGAMNLGMNGVAIEGRSFWRILCAPIAFKRKLAAKFMLPVAVFMPLGFALALVFRIAGFVSWAFFGYAAVVIPCMTVVGSSLGVVVGLVYANWEWDIPKRMITTAGRLVMAIVLGGFLAGTAIIMGRVAEKGYEQVFGFVLRGPRFAVAGVFLLGAGIVAYLLISFASRRLEDMEWKI
jgi:hypothetical protein